MHRWTWGNCARGTKKTDTQVVPAKAHVSENEWSCGSLEENTFGNLCRRKPHFQSSEGFHFCVRGSGSRDNRLFPKTTTNSGLSTSCSYLSQFYPQGSSWTLCSHTVCKGQHSTCGNLHSCWPGNQTSQTVEPHTCQWNVGGREGSPSSVYPLLWLIPNIYSKFFYHSVQSKVFSYVLPSGAVPACQFSNYEHTVHI